MADSKHKDRPDETCDASPEGTSSSRWLNIVRSVQDGDKKGLEELYAIFSKGIRFFLCRQLGPQELDDRVHDTFVIVVEAIKRGDLREPDRLMGFVRTIVRRQVAAYIDAAVQTRREQADIDAGLVIVDRAANPEREAMGREQEDFMLRVLSELSSRDREILIRFYLREEEQETICSEMNLTDTQFRLLKSRAKARFGDLGRKRLQANNLTSLFVRSISGSEHLFR